MIRKITLFILLFIGYNNVADAWVHDSVTIFMPYGMDTTCPGTQLSFFARQSNDTFSFTRYHWYTNSHYTGVAIDTFYSTALLDGDTVFCTLVYRNSLGNLDSFTSDSIIIHRRDTIAPRILLSITAGRNPDSAGNPITMTAYPVNGGSSPAFQWMINGLPVPAEDSVTMTKIFSAGDTVTCQMISNSTCAAPYSLIDTSNMIIISHDSLHALISIVTTHNPICAGTKDTFTATITSPGIGASLAWYVNSTLIPGALGPTYITDTLHNGNLVYCVLNTPDHCVINDSTVSNIITMTVIPLLPTSDWVVLTHGSNPGCLDSPVTFTGHYINFGTTPTYDWYVNGVLIAHDTTVFTYFYLNNDQVTFKVNATDNGCYTNDTLPSATVLMLRDSTPVTPMLSLIGNLLVVNNGGHFIWYYNSVNSCVGATILPGVINQTYNPHAQGYYFVVKDSVNCPSMCSNVIYISLLGVANINNARDVKIYPNPTYGMLNFDWDNHVENIKLDVFNILGQPMLHENIKDQSHHETDISSLPEGNYIVVLRDEDGSKATYKVYLQK